MSGNLLFILSPALFPAAVPSLQSLFHSKQNEMKSNTDLIWLLQENLKYVLFQSAHFPSQISCLALTWRWNIMCQVFLPKDLGTAVRLPSGTLALSCVSVCPRPRVLTHCDRIRLGGLAPFYRRKPEVQEHLVYSHPHPLRSEMFAGSSSPIGWVQTCLVRHSRLPMIAPQSITAVCFTLLLRSHPTPAEMTYSLFPYPSTQLPLPPPRPGFLWHISSSHLHVSRPHSQFRVWLKCWVFHEVFHSPQPELISPKGSHSIWFVASALCFSRCVQLKLEHIAFLSSELLYKLSGGQGKYQPHLIAQTEFQEIARSQVVLGEWMGKLLGTLFSEVGSAKCSCVGCSLLKNIPWPNMFRKQCHLYPIPTHPLLVIHSAFWHIKGSEKSCRKRPV